MFLVIYLLRLTYGILFVFIYFKKKEDLLVLKEFCKYSDFASDDKENY